MHARLNSTSLWGIVHFPSQHNHATGKKGEQLTENLDVDLCSALERGKRVCRCSYQP